jgi:hypothetical protein
MLLWPTARRTDRATGWPPSAPASPSEQRWHPPMRHAPPPCGPSPQYGPSAFLATSLTVSCGLGLTPGHALDEGRRTRRHRTPGSRLDLLALQAARVRLLPVLRPGGLPRPPHYPAIPHRGLAGRTRSGTAHARRRRSPPLRRLHPSAQPCRPART